MSNRIIFLLIAILATSCVSQKKLIYFQPKDKNSDVENQAITENYTPKIQPGDILNIDVFSLNPQDNALFNSFSIESTLQQSAPQTSQSTTLPPVKGFLVDVNGTITMPLAGKITVGGLSTKEASDTIMKELKLYLMQPTVSVRILNFKISVLGEVLKPSVYTISNERVTLLEALSLAGDLTIFGRRTNILVIREENGKREFGRVDLTQRDFFESPYYYLRPNDIVYVEPSRGKVISSGSAVTILPIVISSLTLVILSIYYIHESK